MELVVDANVLFAALIKEGETADIFFQHTLYAPEFILEEFLKHKSELLAKTRRNPEDFDEVFDVLVRNIILIPKEEILPYMKAAEKICPDKDDVPYFALCLKLNCAFWSNDLRLCKQDRIKIISTAELIRDKNYGR